ncbi:MAG: hypothetical protein QM817_26160 [Archangium sp.]
MSKSELERQLREGGEKVSAGKIRIDSKRALQRLRDFRFSDPSHWILEVLRAAAESNANTVDIETDSNDVIITFGGAPLSDSAMEHLLDRALEPGDTKEERRVRLLALGVAGALGAGAAWVKVESGNRELLLEGEDVKLTTRTVKATRVHLHKAFGWRVITGFVRGSPEAEAVKTRVRSFPAKLKLDGKVLVPAGGHAFEPTASKPGELTTVRVRERKKGWVLDVEFDPDDLRRASTLWLEVSGVTVSSRQLELPGLPLHAWLSSSELRRNASGSDVLDDDETLLAAQVKLRELSVELLDAHLVELCGNTQWRRRLAAMLQTANADSNRNRLVVDVLHNAPLFPGPSNDWSTYEQLAEAVKRNGCLHVATEHWPANSYPSPTVLLKSGADDIEHLLPEGKRVDVRKVVQQRRRVALARAELESRTQAEVELGDSHWDLRGTVSGSSAKGLLGLDERERGAFVKLLAGGRFFHAGEATTLAPLRLRAVINWEKPLGDTYFEEGGEEKLFGLVLRPVEEAATELICAGLANGKSEAVPHAIDLLTRLAQRNTKRSDLPARLRAAKLFEVIGGKRFSLDEFDGWKRWPFVLGQRTQPLLSGEDVLLLTNDLHALFKKLGGKKLEEVSTQLDFERSIRRRMDGPPEPAAVTDPHVALVKVSAPNASGEVALPKEREGKLTLTVLRDGLRLETTQLSAKFGAARAVIDSPALVPNDTWNAVKRDAAWQAVLTAVQDAERRLGAELVKVPRHQWGANGETYLEQFLARELRHYDPAKLDEFDRAVVEAPLFDAGARRISLAELSKQSRLLAWTRPGPSRPTLPSELQHPVIFESGQLVALLSDALGRPFEDAAPELERAEARRRLDAQPELKFELEPRAALEARVSGASWTALAGLREGTNSLARVEVRVQRRAWITQTRSAAFPVSLIVDLPQLTLDPARTLTKADDGRVADALAAAQQELVTEALGEWRRAKSEAAQTLLLLALGREFDETLSSKLLASDLRSAEVFPCTDGKLRAAMQLESPVQFVKSPLEGSLPNKRPIVVADSEFVRIGLYRFDRAVDVEDALRLQNQAMRERESVTAVAEVKSSVESWFRQRINENGITGEVAIAREGGGRLELFIEKKALCTLGAALPPTFAAAIDSPRLHPKPGFTGVEQDAGYEEVLALVEQSGARLAEKVANEPIPPGWEGAVVRLAFHVATAQAWEWKGKKKGKGKKARAETTSPTHALVRKPLLRANDGTTLCVKDLIDSQLANGHVAFAERGGSFLGKAHRAWWPREGERDAAKALGLDLHDITTQLDDADRVRALPVFERVDAPLQSAWRAAVKGPGLEGEVALHELAAPNFVVEVLHHKRLLERWSAPHPIGGVARVNSELLTPDERFSEAKRDAAFKAMLSAAEAALERAILERVQKHTRGFDAWIRSVMKWKRTGGGPIAEALSALELFESLDGRRITIGRVIELAAKKGKVPVAERVLLEYAPADTLILVHDTANLSGLEALGLKAEVVSDELSRKSELHKSLTTRRLKELRFKGEALARLPLTEGLEGEVVIAFGDGLELVLARDGIPVSRFELKHLGVAGVIGVPELEVNEGWTQATPSRAQKNLIAARIDELFSVLARESPKLGDGDRERAATVALSYLLAESEGGRVEFGNLRAGARAIARAPLFITGEGTRVSLEHLASAASQSGKIAVFERGLRVPSSEVVVVPSFDTPWLTAFETALGKNKVWKVRDVSQWEQAAREADPPVDSALAHGLEQLRKNVRLLRSGALGRLTPEDLEDVKLSRDGGKTALRYDGKRKLVLLDPEHPHVARALGDVRAFPERLWVLLAAIFGVVNRALENVTDEHEAQLALALAAHLAANPQLLEPKTRNEQ